MQLRYLKNVILKKSTKTKQDNGTYIETFTDVKTYEVQEQELTDEVSASIYGADLNKVTRIKSTKRELEIYLKTKLNNESDNISKYFIEIDGILHKIKSVKNNWIDITI